MSRVARRYAKAIFSLAGDEKSLEETGGELERLGAVAREAGLGAAIASPLLSPDNRAAIARTLAEQLSLRPTTRNFVALLAANNRLSELGPIAEEYTRLLDRALGRVRARITSAVKLAPEQEKTITEVLSRMTGKTVLATTVVDPELLGGLVVEVEGKVYDGSLQTQLHRLANNIAGGRSFM